LLDEYHEWYLLTALARRVKDSKLSGSHTTYDVNFIIATVPDYVDSNSGWLADETLAAIQSSMVRSGYVLDRPQLVDWSRSAAKADGLTSTSRLHERQPGALLFRRVDPKTRLVALQVVLLVLETPTGGVHHAALRNAAAFVRAWKRCAGESRRVLRILGPTFSGSTASLAVVLNEIRRHDDTSFQKTWVVSGSATADSNVLTMDRLAPGVKYHATVLATSILERRMAAFLEQMNPLWSKGNRVALLAESNTAYGQNQRPGDEQSLQQEESHSAFPHAEVFNFPLHVSQLWSERPDTTQAPLFAPGLIGPLNLREAAPPSDQIPALRPALTSAVVGSTVEAILDAIRHEKLSAVGIIATDNRDALFLAREVKRSTPDAQLFLFGTHALYLHPDYVPYLRGALVASSYSLALANQPETVAWWPGNVREPFQSLSSEGVFNATHALLSLKEEDTVQLDDCGSKARAQDPCIRVPQATINVIGEDGYWTLPFVPNPPIAGESPATATKTLLPPLPLRATLAALIVIGIVGLHILMLRRIRDDLRSRRKLPTPAASTLEWPIVRMFAPPRTVPGAARNHLLALKICALFLGLAAAWVVVTIVPFMIGLSYCGVTLTGTLALASLAITVVPSWAWSSESKGLIDDTRKGADFSEAPSEMTPVAKGLFLTVLVTLGVFAAVTVQTLLLAARPTAGALTLARYVGGGFVSPVALTLFTLVALYVAIITGLRRLSLVGDGYAHLTAGSSVFSLLTGEKPRESTETAPPSQFACMLDMPAQNLPAPYLSAVVAVAAVAAICLLRISSIEGPLFTVFLGVSSLAILAIGLLLLAQGLATWNIARSHLKRLVNSPIEARLASVASYVPWDISLAPPKLTQLMPVARMADGIIREFRQIAGFPPLIPMGRQGRRAADSSPEFFVSAAAAIRLRKDDLRDDQELHPLFAAPTYVEHLTTEMEQRQHAALIQSDTWFRIWKLSDAIVSAMQRSVWQRSSAPTDEQSAPELESADSLGHPLTPQSLASLIRPEEHKTLAQPLRSEAGWFERCERLVAMQLAFVFPDIVARTVTLLFAAMLCLTLLTVAHLLYSFNGRNTTLTIDMLAVAATAVVSVWILVDMERDHILSRLRATTPGRVDINWDFIRRITVYGVFPLLVVIASLFPEVGGALFGWLEPLRKLSSF
jgi:hypothetical protein